MSSIVANPDAEAVTIAYLLQDPRRLAEFAGLEPIDLEERTSRLVLNAARNYHLRALEQGKVRYAPRDAVERFVIASLHKPTGSGKKDKERRKFAASFRSALDTLSQWPIVTNSEFEDALDQVRKAASARRLRRGLLSIVDAMEDGKVRRATERLKLLATQAELASQGATDGTFSEDVVHVISDYSRTKRDGHGRIDTPIPRLNAVTGGGRRGRMWMISAYSGGGKTNIALNLIYHAATVGKLGCVVVTSEQTKQDVRMMLAVRHTHKFVRGGIPYRLLEDGTLSKTQEAVLRSSVQDIRTADYGPISYWQAPRGTRTTDIRAYVDRCATKHPVEVLMVDHTLLFDPSETQRDTRSNVARVIMELKQISLGANRGKGLWLLACHQISRDGYKEALKRGYHTLTDLGESSEAERSADVVLWAFRDDTLKDNNEVRIGIAKDRRGAGEPRGFEAYEQFSSCAVLPIEDDAAQGGTA